MAPPIDPKKILADCAKRVEAHLDAVVPSAEEPPETIHQAMRHSLKAGGKRLRPALVMMAAKAAGIDESDRALPVAAALEMIHTYSLIHDDLPCMDDDDLRRGQPTCHVVYGEAMAVLAGDALLTLAFTHIGEAAESGIIPPTALPGIIAHLGRCAGTPIGMVAGQVADIEGEDKDLGPEGLEFIHRRKTGALIETSCVCGALVAEAPEASVTAMRDYARALGLAFQIVDDILDATSTSEKMGKTIGKDNAQGKTTYVSVHGLDAAKEMAHQQVEMAKEALGLFGDAGSELAALADFVVSRDC